MLARHDDGALGGQALGQPLDGGTDGLGGPPAPAPGTAGPLARRRLRGNRKRYGDLALLLRPPSLLL